MNAAPVMRKAPRWPTVPRRSGATWESWEWFAFGVSDSDHGSWLTRCKGLRTSRAWSAARSRAAVCRRSICGWA